MMLERIVTPTASKSYVRALLGFSDSSYFLESARSHLLGRHLFVPTPVRHLG